MADNQVQPVQGQAAPAHPGPAPVPRRQQRFRAAAQTSQAMPDTVPEFPVARGLPPELVHADGYQSVEVPQTGLNTFIPSYINYSSRVFLTNQKLCANDKFLKEQAFYDPRAFDLYCAFLFVYHNLRVRAEAGSLSVAEDTLLSNMRSNYKEVSLPVPGNLVLPLMAMTMTENPYSWQGNTLPTVPANTEFQAGLQGYILDNNLHQVYPCIPMLVAQIYARTAHAARPTDAVCTALATNIYRLDRQIVQTGNPERFWLQTPHGRYPDPSTPRTIQTFYDAVRGSATAPYLNRFVLDLPVLNNNTSTANMTLTTYLGLTDAEGVANRRTQFLRWPAQLANMAGTVCKYVSGSRYLADINTTGLGAQTSICRYVPGTIFEDRDPDVVQGGPAGANITVYSNYHVISLNATMNVRDPVISDLAVQFSMLGQVNVNLDQCVDNTGAVVTNVPTTLRVGEFWDYPVCEIGPEAAVANILISHLPNYVRSNPRHNAED